MIKDIDKYFPGTNFPDELELSLKELTLEINDTAREKGFWSEMNSVLGKMAAFHKVDSSGAVQDEKVFTDEEILAVKKAFIQQKLMLIVSELGEATNSDRKTRYADWDEFDKLYKEFRQSNHRVEHCFQWAFEGAIKDTFEDEVADSIIRHFDVTEEMGIDILKHIIYKMVFNTTREHKHGKDY